jgi:hypothetical protein
VGSKECGCGFVDGNSVVLAYSWRFLGAITQAKCRSDCQIQRVECSRVTCGDFQIPDKSVGTRAGASGGGGSLAAGDTASGLLFGETLLVDCLENHRLATYTAGCQDRGFQVGRASLPSSHTRVQ